MKIAHQNVIDYVQLQISNFKSVYFCALCSASYQPAKVIDKSVNLNAAVDALLPSIRKFILNNGMDPMQLVDFSEPIFPHMVSIFY